MGKFITAGSDLVFCAQYITNGVAGSDQSSVGLVFFKQPPSQRVITLALALISQQKNKKAVVSWHNSYSE